MALMLRIKGGKHDGQEIRVQQKKKYLIGRAEDCHLRPGGDKVSRYHAALMIDEPMIVIRDLGSTNGTFLNGVRLEAPVELKNGDVVTVGGLSFETVITTLRTNTPVPGTMKSEMVLGEEGDVALATGDTHIMSQEQVAKLGLDLAGPAPRQRPPTFGTPGRMDLTSRFPDSPSRPGH